MIFLHARGQKQSTTYPSTIHSPVSLPTYAPFMRILLVKPLNPRIMVKDPSQHQVWLDTLNNPTSQACFHFPTPECYIKLYSFCQENEITSNFPSLWKTSTAEMVLHLCKHSWSTLDTLPTQRNNDFSQLAWPSLLAFFAKYQSISQDFRFRTDFPFSYQAKPSPRTSSWKSLKPSMDLGRVPSSFSNFLAGRSGHPLTACGIEHPLRNGWFAYQKWWFSIVHCEFTRGYVVKCWAIWGELPRPNLPVRSHWGHIYQGPLNPIPWTIPNRGI